MLTLTLALESGRFGFVRIHLNKFMWSIRVVRVAERCLCYICIRKKRGIIVIEYPVSHPISIECSVILYANEK